MAPTQPKAGKSPSKPKEPKDSDLKKQLLFLWICHKVSDVNIDIPAVAKHFGIKNKAAQMRYTRLKKKLDEMEASNEEAHGKDKDTEDEGDIMSD
ncbi:hypothetical protein N7519_004812 [Penicillium mononematosum]|uniref:uncharacterized protein n=1 Tax=Penicillium mononematosum TaxID=268346 RepID=UPI0025470E65|nr:uncharacterized protein N7519_004812 [Penicillium mononematosum]KAJ6189904.1 hypothetical protein N7519_004812 [Penicillium mononematosum]